MVIDKSILENGITELDDIKDFGRKLATPIKETNHKTGKTFISKNALSTSQIRKFFGAIKRIQAGFEEHKHEILLLEPKLAYAVGRDEGKTKINDFYKALSPLIKDINQDKKKFNNFVSIVEAIVAYHKAKGGK